MARPSSPALWVYGRVFFFVLLSRAMSVRGKTVLLVGDSHTVGSYGTALRSLLSDAGARVTTVAHVGAKAGDYLTGKYAEEFRTTARNGVDILIITLGTNDAGWTDSIKPTKTAENMQSIAKAVGAGATYWVGPPSFHPDSARLYNDAFARNDLNQRADSIWVATAPLFGTRAIDPREVTKPYAARRGPTTATPKGDIHLDLTGGKAWAEYVFGKIDSEVASTSGSVVRPQQQVAMNASAVGVLAAVLVVLALRLITRRRPAQ